MAAREIFPVIFITSDKPGPADGTIKDFRPVSVPADSPEPVKALPKAPTPAPIQMPENESGSSHDSGTSETSTGSETPPAQVLSPPPMK